MKKVLQPKQTYAFVTAWPAFSPSFKKSHVRRTDIVMGWKGPDVFGGLFQTANHQVREFDIPSR